jgi:hypothetical protein
MAERFGAGKILIGEVLPYPRDVDYIGAMGEMLDFCFDGVFAEGLFSTDTICVEDLSHALLQGAFNEVSYAHNITYLSNHDRGRLAAKTRGYSHEKGKLMAALQFLSNGAPLLYYGDEVALVAADECPPHLRAVSAMAWDGSTQGGFTRGGASPLCPSRNAGGCNVEAQEAETASLLNYYRSLITFRRSQPAFQRAKRRELSSANPRLHAYCLYDESGVMLIVHNLAETPVNGSIGLPRPLRDEPARILFGEEAISCQAQGECLLVRRLDGYRSAALLFDSARAEAFAHRQEDSCITFPRMDAGPARILAAPDCGSWAASVATRESDAMVECFSVRRNQAECWHRIRAPGRERLLLPLPDDTRYVSVTGDADLDFVPLDWREHFAARTRLICESDRNHYLRRLQCGADEAFWHIHLTHDAVPPIPVGGGIDCVFLLIDSAAAPRVQRLAFWLLPEIAVSGPVDAIIICQRQAGENRAILYTDSSQSILPGVRRKDALISHYDETELFLMVNRSALPRSRYGLGAFVWSAAGRWLDAAGERGACREALPHLRPRDSRGAGSDLDTYVDLCA